MYNFKWLSSICHIPVQPWHLDPVLRISDIQNIDFYSRQYKMYRSIINLSDIKGIEFGFSDFVEKDINWKSMLNDLSGIDKILGKIYSLEDLITYVKEDDSQPKRVLKYGNDYIIAGAKHRLILAKFLGIKEMEVSVKEYVFDNKRYMEYQSRKSNLDQFLQRRLISEIDYEKALHNNEKSFPLKVGQNYVMVDNDMALPILETYSKLSINNFSLFLDNISELVDKKLGLDIYSNLHIRAKEDLKYIKPTLRFLKNQNMQESNS